MEDNSRDMNYALIRLQRFQLSTMEHFAAVQLHTLLPSTTMQWIPLRNISWQLGLKTYFKNGHLKVLNVLEGSAAYDSLVVKEDEILSINDFRIDNNLDHWLNYFENDQIVLKVSRNGKILDINMNSSNDNQYFKYKFFEE